MDDKTIDKVVIIAFDSVEHRNIFLLICIFIEEPKVSLPEDLISLIKD